MHRFLETAIFVVNQTQRKMLLTQLQSQSKAYAQLAGVLYLIIAVIGAFSIGYVPSVIVAEGNAALTFQQLTNHLNLFKLGMAGDIAVLVFEVLLTVLLYKLFKRYSATGMTIATFTRLAMAIIMGVNLLNYVVPVLFITHPELASTLQKDELETLTLLFFKIHHYGILTWQLFFAIHLFTLGYVIQKSVITSKWLGILMLVGGIGYGGDSLVQLLFLNSQALSIFFSCLLVLAVIGEFWFAFWLIVNGGQQLSANSND